MFSAVRLILPAVLTLAKVPAIPAQAFLPGTTACYADESWHNPNTEKLNIYLKSAEAHPSDGYVLQIHNEYFDRAPSSEGKHFLRIHVDEASHVVSRKEWIAKGISRIGQIRALPGGRMLYSDAGSAPGQIRLILRDTSDQDLWTLNAGVHGSLHGILEIPGDGYLLSMDSLLLRIGPAGDSLWARNFPGIQFLEPLALGGDRFAIHARDLMIKSRFLLLEADRSVSFDKTVSDVLGPGGGDPLHFRRLPDGGLLAVCGGRIARMDPDFKVRSVRPLSLENGTPATLPYGPMLPLDSAGFRFLFAGEIEALTGEMRLAIIDSTGTMSRPSIKSARISNGYRNRASMSFVRSRQGRITLFGYTYYYGFFAIPVAFSRPPSFNGGDGPEFRVSPTEGFEHAFTASDHDSGDVLRYSSDRIGTNSVGTLDSLTGNLRVPPGRVSISEGITLYVTDSSGCMGQRSITLIADGSVAKTADRNAFRIAYRSDVLDFQIPEGFDADIPLHVALFRPDGRLAWKRTLTGLGPGRHGLPLGEAGTHLTPGIYHCRISGMGKPVSLALPLLEGR